MNENQERLLKVIVWRVCSILLTLVTTWLYTGDVKKSTGITMVLHLVLIVAHYLFEFGWDTWVQKKQQTLD